jgi:hypothetical protein
MQMIVDQILHENDILHGGGVTKRGPSPHDVFSTYVGDIGFFIICKYYTIVL